MEPTLAALDELAAAGMTTFTTRNVHALIARDRAGTSANRVRHAVRILERRGVLTRVSYGRYRRTDLPPEPVITPPDEDDRRPMVAAAERTRLAGASASELIREALQDLPGPFCLGDLYSVAAALGGTSSETALRMGITALLRQPAPPLERVSRGVYRRARP